MISESPVGVFIGYFYIPDSYVFYVTHLTFVTLK